MENVTPMTEWNSIWIELAIVGAISFCAGWLLHKYLTPKGQQRATNVYSVAPEQVKEDPEQLKMILLVRDDLKMGKGKIAAQCCHAAVALYDMINQDKTQRGEKWRITLRRWEDIGAKKIVVKVNSEKDLDEVFDKIPHDIVPTVLIQDAGLTQIEVGSKTVLGIGPCNFTYHKKNRSIKFGG